MRKVPGVEDLGLFRVLGQPNLNISVDRQQAARHGINVSDVQDAVETAIGGKAVSQVLQGEQRYDLVARYEAPYRDTKEAIENIRLVAPSGERVALSQLAKIECEGWGFADQPRREFAVCGDQIQRARARSRERGGRSDEHGEGSR